MTNEDFLNEVEKRLSRHFSASKSGYKIPAIERHRLEGFIQAGVFMGLTTNVEMKGLMDSIHMSIFGKTIEEHKALKSINMPEWEIDYSQYEQPTFERID